MILFVTGIYILQVYDCLKNALYLCFSEKVVVPADKPYITLSGTNANSTIITWNEAWFNQQSATLSILASDFVGRYLTVQVQK